jgi:hypothetical protein
VPNNLNYAGVSYAVDTIPGSLYPYRAYVELRSIDPCSKIVQEWAGLTAHRIHADAVEEAKQTILRHFEERKQRQIELSKKIKKRYERTI